jgi:hypothetical protein
MILSLQDEQVWLSRAEGGVPVVIACFHTKVSTKVEHE